MTRVLCTPHVLHARPLVSPTRPFGSHARRLDPQCLGSSTPDCCAHSWHHRAQRSPSATATESLAAFTSPASKPLPAGLFSSSISNSKSPRPPTPSSPGSALHQDPVIVSLPSVPGSPRSSSPVAISFLQQACKHQDSSNACPSLLSSSRLQSMSESSSTACSTLHHLQQPSRSFRTLNAIKRPTSQGHQRLDQQTIALAPKP